MWVDAVVAQVAVYIGIGSNFWFNLLAISVTVMQSSSLEDFIETKTLL